MQNFSVISLIVEEKEQKKTCYTHTYSGSIIIAHTSEQLQNRQKQQSSSEMYIKFDISQGNVIIRYKNDIKMRFDTL